MSPIYSDKMIVKNEGKVKYSCCGDVCSDALFGVSIAKVEGFRSQSHVNADEDMVRVVLDMPKRAWRHLQKILPTNTKDKVEE